MPGTKVIIPTYCSPNLQAATFSASIPGYSDLELDFHSFVRIALEPGDVCAEAGRS